MGVKGGRRCGAVVGIFLLMVVESVAASPLIVTPYLSLKETYTDNIRLVGVGKQEEFVTTVSPGMSVSKETARHRLDLDYKMENFIYKNDTRGNETRHKFDAKTESELIKKTLYFDMRAKYDPSIIDYSRSTPVNDVNSLDNRVDSWVFMVSPYVERFFSGVGLGEARYRYLRTRYDDNDYSDSKTDHYQVRLRNESSDKRTQWKLEALRREIEYDQGGISRFDKAWVDARYMFIDSWSLIGTLGYEDNDYDVVPSKITLEGPYWFAGLAWTPNERTEVEVAAGEREYGNAYRGFVKYRARYSDWRVSYKEDYVTSTDLRLSSVVPDSITGEVSPDLRSGTYTNEPYLEKRVTLAGVVRARRNTLNLTAMSRKNEFPKGSGTEDIIVARAEWTMTLTRYSDVVISYKWRQTDFAKSNRRDTWWTGGVGIKSELSKSIEGSLFYRYLENESENSPNDYIENSVIGRILIHIN